MMMTLKNFLMSNWVILVQLYSAAVFVSGVGILHITDDDTELQEAVTGITLMCAGNLIATILMVKPWTLYDYTGLLSGTATLASSLSRVAYSWIAFAKGLSPQAVIGLVIVFVEGLCFEAYGEKIQELMEKFYFYDHH